MSINSEIQRIADNISDAYEVCQTKGATLPQVQNSNNLAECIDTIGASGGLKLNILSPSSGNTLHVSEAIRMTVTGSDNQITNYIIINNELFTHGYETSIKIEDNENLNLNPNNNIISIFSLSTDGKFDSKTVNNLAFDDTCTIIISNYDDYTVKIKINDYQEETTDTKNAHYKDLFNINISKQGYQPFIINDRKLLQRRYIIDYPYLFKYLTSDGQLGDELSVYSNSIAGSNYSYKAFNNSESDCWECSNTTSERYLEWRTSTKINIKTLNIRCGVNYEDIKNFKLKASKDGITWVELGSYTGTKTSGEYESFDVSSNNNYYNHHRISIPQNEKNIQGSNYISIYHLKLEAYRYHNQLNRYTINIINYDSGTIDATINNINKTSSNQFIVDEEDLVVINIYKPDYNGFYFRKYISENTSLISPFLIKKIYAYGTYGDELFITQSNMSLSYAPYNLFNWNNNESFNSNTSSERYIAWHTQTKINIKNLYIKMFSSDTIKNFKLQASNDGITWVDLGSYTNTITTDYAIAEFDVSSNNNYYNHHRIYIAQGEKSIQGNTYIKFSNVSLDSYKFTGITPTYNLSVTNSGNPDCSMTINKLYTATLTDGEIDIEQDAYVDMTLSISGYNSWNRQFYLQYDKNIDNLMFYKILSAYGTYGDELFITQSNMTYSSSPYNLFNWNNNNVICSNNTNERYIAWHTQTKVNIKKIYIKIYSGYTIKNFKLQASNDGLTWIDLGNYTNTITTDNAIAEFDVSSNNNYYNHHRIYIAQGETSISGSTYTGFRGISLDSHKFTGITPTYNLSVTNSGNPDCSMTINKLYTATLTDGEIDIEQDAYVDMTLSISGYNPWNRQFYLQYDKNIDNLMFYKILSAYGTYGNELFITQSNMDNNSYPYSLFNWNNNDVFRNRNSDERYIAWHTQTKVNIKKIYIKIWSSSLKNFKLQASNDGTNWNDIKSFTNTITTDNAIAEFDVSSNNNYYHHHRIYIAQGETSIDGSTYTGFRNISLDSHKFAGITPTYNLSVTNSGNPNCSMTINNLYTATLTDGEIDIEQDAYVDMTLSISGYNSLIRKFYITDDKNIDNITFYKILSNYGTYGDELFVTDSGSSSSNAGYYVFNDTVSNTWTSNETSAERYIAWHTQTSVNIKKLYLKIASTYTIKNFKLQASNDGLTWIDLGNYTNTITTDNAIVEFDVSSNNNYYNHHRIYIAQGETSIQNNYYIRIRKISMDSHKFAGITPTYNLSVTTYPVMIDDMTSSMTINNLYTATLTDGEIDIEQDAYVDMTLSISGYNSLIRKFYITDDKNMNYLYIYKTLSAYGQEGDELFVTVSGNSGTNYGYYVFDDTVSNTWTSNETSAERYIAWHTQTSVNIKKLYLKIASTYTIKNFKLQASNDGLTWIDLGNYTNTITTDNAIVEFDVSSNNNYYNHHRIYIAQGETSIQNNYYIRIRKISMDSYILVPELLETPVLITITNYFSESDVKIHNFIDYKTDEHECIYDDNIIIKISKEKYKSYNTILLPPFSETSYNLDKPYLLPIINTDKMVGVDEIAGFADSYYSGEGKSYGPLDNGTSFWNSTSTQFPHYYGIWTILKINIKKFTLECRHDSYSYEIPGEFILQGSNDGTNWNDIESFTNTTHGNGMKISFDCYENEDYYNYHRFYISSNATGNGLVTSIYELYLDEVYYELSGRSIPVSFTITNYNNADILVKNLVETYTTNTFELLTNLPTTVTLTKQSYKPFQTILNIPETETSYNLDKPYLVPIITANGTIGEGEIAVYADTQYAIDHAAWHIFDNNQTTKWAGTDGSQQHWIAFWTNHEICIHSFTLYARTDGYTNQFPKTFVVEGSDDGTTWTEIESFTTASQPSTSGSVHYTITNPSSYYNHHRVRQIQSFGGNNFSIGEISLDEAYYR